MVHTRAFLTLLLTGTILQGCNTAENDNVSPPPEEAPVEKDGNHMNQGYTKQNEGHLFNFTSFDLDIEYQNNQSYEIDYENERDGMEADIEDEVDNTTLKGNEAFEQLSPKFEKFTFDSSTSDEEVITEVLKAFKLNTDYTKFELDIEFTDGKRKKYSKLNK